MQFIDINRIYTQRVAEYLAAGYIIDSRSMGCTFEPSKIASIDLTNGEELLRIALERITDCGIYGVQIATYRLKYPRAAVEPMVIITMNQGTV